MKGRKKLRSFLGSSSGQPLKDNMNTSIVYGKNVNRNLNYKVEEGIYQKIFEVSKEQMSSEKEIDTDDKLSEKQKLPLISFDQNKSP